MEIPDLESYLKQMMEHNLNRAASGGSDDYPEIRLPTFIQTERSLLCLGEKQDKAFVIANKADVIWLHERKKAAIMAFKALDYDVDNIDALRVLSACTLCATDTVTKQNFLREILTFVRPRFEQTARESPTQFYMIPQTRTYLRIVYDIADTNQHASMYDQAVYAYEEMIRLNRSDWKQVRGRLLGIYIIIMALNEKGQVTRPIRKVEHLEALCKADLSGAPTYEQRDVAVRWSEIFLAWKKRNKQEFDKLVQEELKRTDWLFKLIFHEVRDIPKATPPPGEVPFLAGDFLVGSDQDDARRIGPHFGPAFDLWPDFIDDLHWAVRKKPFKGKIEQNPVLEHRFAVKHCEIFAAHFLEEGRKLLTNKKINEAKESFSNYMGMCYMIAVTRKKKFLEITNFAAFSNRATCDYSLGDYNMCRYDSRMTLALKPDHDRTYLRIPAIANAFKSKQVAEESQKLVDKVKAGVKQNEWRNLAKRAIALLSIPAIILGRKGELTEEKIKELMDVGVDDIYTSVNFPASVHPLLPWLQSSDLQK